jgi:hypothetical protein
MKARVKKIAPKTKQELEQIISEIWDESDQERMNRLHASFTSRLELVIKARGRGISPYLSSYPSEPMPEDVAASREFRPFTAEENESILHWVVLLENHWKKICEIRESHSGPRERTEITHRANWLTDIRKNRKPPEPLDTSSLPEEEPLNSAEFFRGPPFAPDMPSDRLTPESVGI